MAGRTKAGTTPSEAIKETLEETKAASGEEKTEEAPTEVRAKTTAKKTPSPTVKIIINEQDGIDGSDDVFVGVNGKQYLIQRGKEVVVSRAILNVLKESVIKRIEYDDQGNERERSVPRYSVSILGDG